MATMREAQTGSRIRFWSAGIAVLALVLIVGGAVLAVRYVQGDAARDLIMWQTRLGQTADSRVTAIDTWLEQQKTMLADMAALPSVALYAERLRAEGGGRDAEALIGYLRNLLMATAERHGITSADPSRTTEIPVTVPGGLSLVTPDGRRLAATPGAPAVAGSLSAARARQDSVWDEPVLIDRYGGDRPPSLAVVAPVFGERGASEEPVAFIIGIRSLAPVFEKLSQPGDISATTRTDLVRADRGLVTYLSPGEGSDAARLRLADAETRDLAAALAVKSPGRFTRAWRYDGREVLMTSRAVNHMPWVLVRSVTVEEALGPAQARRLRLVLIAVLILAAAAALGLLVWRQRVAAKAAREAAEMRSLANEYQNVSGFLRAVTDSQPSALIALDGAGRIRFANQRAAADTGRQPEAMIGRTLSEIYGPEAAVPLLEMNRQAASGDAVVSDTRTVTAPDGEHVIMSAHVPIRDGDEAGILVVMDDVTALAAERARREETLRGVMRTLLTLIDRRDPYAAGHSMRAAEVARAVAEELDLEDSEIDTVTYAAALLNVGKMLVSPEVLNKPGPLSAGEREAVREAIAESAALVADIDFDGPVAETIAATSIFGDPDSQDEGPVALYARIVAAANVFVALVSPRAWRSGRDFDSALAEIRDRASVPDDRRVVTALANVLDNRGGRERWRHFTAPADGLPPTGHGESPGEGES